MGHKQEERWETELWDAFPKLSTNVLQSISWLQRFGKISNGLHKLNKDYGKGLAKLVKKESKSGEEGTSVGDCHKHLMQHFLSLAGKHKQIAVSLGALAREYDGEAKRLLEEHKLAESEAKKLQGELEFSKSKLEKSRDKYQKRQIEADRAEDDLNKAEPDASVSRAELEKLKENADDRRARANRSREDYSQQLLLTNSHQKGFYRETWPKMFRCIEAVGKEAEEGINELLSKLVSGGLDQWPEPVEAWGEIDNFRELLDYRGDFASFVILSKSGNPCPKDFSFVEPPKNSSFTPMTTMGTLRRSISRQSLRYRTTSFPKTSGKFPSMFSVRNGSIRSHKRSQSNTEDVKKSTDTIDQIEEEETINVNKEDTETISQELKILTTNINSYVEEDTISAAADNHEINGFEERYVDSELVIEKEPNDVHDNTETEFEEERVHTPVDHEKTKVNPFETDPDPTCDVESREEEVHCDSVPIYMNGIESDKSVKEDESCKNFNGNETTDTHHSEKEADNNDETSCKIDEVETVQNNNVEIKIIGNHETDLDSNDNISITGRNYKYDDRKNPFMDEIFDESLTSG